MWNPFTREHQQLRTIDGARGQHDLSAGQRGLLATFPLEFHAVRPFGARVDEHFGHVRPQGHVQVSSEPNWLQKGLRRTASVTSAHRELIQSVSRLDITVAVPYLVTHFFASLQESNTCQKNNIYTHGIYYDCHISFYDDCNLEFYRFFYGSCKSFMLQTTVIWIFKTNSIHQNNVKLKTGLSKSFGYITPGNYKFRSSISILLFYNNTTWTSARAKCNFYFPFILTTFM